MIVKLRCLHEWRRTGLGVRSHNRHSSLSTCSETDSSRLTPQSSRLGPKIAPFVRLDTRSTRDPITGNSPSLHTTSLATVFSSCSKDEDLVLNILKSTDLRIWPDSRFAAVICGGASFPKPFLSLQYIPLLPFPGPPLPAVRW